jgi:transcription-repair coupling factor (superfamily II helicase)
LRARDLGIVKIEAHAAGSTVLFGERTQIDPAILVNLVQTEPARYRLAANSIRLTAKLDDYDTRFAAIELLLDTLEGRTQRATEARSRA